MSVCPGRGIPLMLVFLRFLPFFPLWKFFFLFLIWIKDLRIEGVIFCSDLLVMSVWITLYWVKRESSQWQFINLDLPVSICADLNLQSKMRSGMEAIRSGMEAAKNSSLHHLLWQVEEFSDCWILELSSWFTLYWAVWGDSGMLSFHVSFWGLPGNRRLKGDLGGDLWLSGEATC